MFNMLYLMYILILQFHLSNGAKILAVYPIPSISHQLYFRSLTMELIRRGHDLTVITTDPAFNETAPDKLREINVHDISYKLWKKFLEIRHGSNDDMFDQLRVAYECMGEIFGKQLQTGEVKKIIQNKNETFDLLIFDGWLITSLIFSHIYKIPAISINSLGPLYGNNENIGAVVNEAYYPSIHHKTTETQFEKFFETVKYYYDQQFFYGYTEKVQSDGVRTALGNNYPDIRDLKSNINLMFINVYAAWDWNRPVPMSLKYMGGMHSISEELLPEDIKSYLDSSANGVIYMSFGTNVLPSTLPKEKILMFAKVLSELPYDVLWKWDLDNMANKPKNIRLFKWLPQSGVLKHPKVKLFITQGGLQSTDEAIAAVVPLIGIPMLGDQWFNTEKYKRYNIGLQLDFQSITEDTIRHAIMTVIGNKSYYTNIIKHRNLMHDQPRKVLDHAIYWIEHVLRHGGSHLRAPAANMPWSEYMEIELVATVVGIFVFCILAAGFGVKILVKVFCAKLNNKRTFLLGK